jgi:hypothetical protein
MGTEKFIRAFYVMECDGAMCMQVYIPQRGWFYKVNQADDGKPGFGEKRSTDGCVSILSCILTLQDSSAFPAQQALGKDAQGVREQDARLQ